MPVSSYASRNGVTHDLAFLRAIRECSRGIWFAFVRCMTKLLLASIALSALVLWAVSCGGGSSGGGGTPTGPSANPPTNNPPQASATINIVSSSGSGAFTPNPVQVPAGGTLQWKNSTAERHVLVMNDGSPIGTLAPGATLTTTIGSGGDFRCVTHPSMVGSINGASAPKPPDDPYAYVARSPAVSER